MATKYLYAVRDSAVAAFMPPFTSTTDNEAVRQFKDAVQQSEKVQLNKQDFWLYRLGVYDEETGYVRDNEPYAIIGADATLNLHGPGIPEEEQQELEFDPAAPAE